MGWFTYRLLDSQREVATGKESRAVGEVGRDPLAYCHCACPKDYKNRWRLHGAVALCGLLVDSCEFRESESGRTFIRNIRLPIPVRFGQSSSLYR